MPAKPPDSFQASSVAVPPSTLTKMPMSWLYPALHVHRSTLPLTSTVSADPVTDCTSWVASMGTQVLPSLPTSGYCCVLITVATPADGIG